MRILHVNKFAFPKGGAEEYMMQLAIHQVDRGDDVAVFGATKENTPLPREVQGYHYDVIDFHAASTVSKKLNSVQEVMWSNRAASAISSAVAEFKPDVVHLHNYAHQMSSSIIPAVRRHGSRVVATAHDYKLVCPAYVATRNGSDCFACSRGVSLKLLRDRCHHGSLAWSGLVAAEALLVRSRKLVPDAVVAPSRFMATALRESWMGESPIAIVRNPAVSSGLRWEGGTYLLYVGRLSREKGVEPLIRSCIEARIPLVVAGDGPIRAELEKISQGFAVEFTGHVGHTALMRLREKCMAQIVPSEWPENAPLSALEAAVDGIPLIASPRGGLPEFAEMGARIQYVDELSGKSLVHATRALNHLTDALENLRQELSWDNHLSKLDNVYRGGFS